MPSNHRGSVPIIAARNIQFFPLHQPSGIFVTITITLILHLIRRYITPGLSRYTLGRIRLLLFDITCCLRLVCECLVSYRCFLPPLLACAADRSAASYTRPPNPILKFAVYLGRDGSGGRLRFPFLMNTFVL